MSLALIVLFSNDGWLHYLGSVMRLHLQILPIRPSIMQLKTRSINDPLTRFIKYPPLIQS